jgi:hypothetical protein
MVEPDPEEQLRVYASALAEGIERAIPAWVVGSVERLVVAWRGSVPEPVRRAAEEAGEQARVEVAPAIHELLAADVDAQRTTPLALLRHAVHYPTAVLRQAGVPAVERDGFAERSFPDDVYDLSPASLADLDPSLAEAGLAWGAAKAFVHRRRHRP